MEVQVVTAIKIKAMRSFFTGRKIRSSFFRNGNQIEGLINNSDPPPPPRMVIAIGILWGIYHSGGPSGPPGGCEKAWSICGIEISVYLANRKTSPAMAGIIGGKLNLHVKAFDMPMEYKKYFLTGIIPVYRDVSLPTEICRRLGISNYIIKAGDYPLIASKDGYHFVL